ncbi:MAG: DUF4314 domain-containing protein [Oscillospiraceae bacterium]|nr:DUF4314 domain-containing protein [Oscillospiraceae bacterium]
MSRAYLALLRGLYSKGTRVKLTALMHDPYSTLKPGDCGSITGVDDAGNLMVDWDNGSRLNLLPDVDSFRKLEGGEPPA